MTDTPITAGTYVLRDVDGIQQVGIVRRCYGTLPHSAVEVENVVNTITGAVIELPMTWLYGECTFVFGKRPANPLPFDEGA
jgi:hypothetical protein